MRKTRFDYLHTSASSIFLFLLEQDFWGYIVLAEVEIDYVHDVCRVMQNIFLVALFKNSLLCRGFKGVHN